MLILEHVAFSILPRCQKDTQANYIQFHSVNFIHPHRESF